MQEAWRENAIDRLLAERAAAPFTPVRALSLRCGRQLLFKDESVHPSGSLKHRLARALYLHHLRDGRLAPGMAVFDASSGSTAVSEAWFAERLGLRHFAVIPEHTSPAKQALIRSFGGECITVNPQRCCKQEAARLAQEHGGVFLDQFGNAARVVEWHAHNVAVELFTQLAERGMPLPDAFICGAGTGGTAASTGRFLRRTGRATRLLVVDPEESAFYAHFTGREAGCLCASRVEGIGRPAVEPAFDPALIDAMLRVPDAASFAAARWLKSRLGWSVGVSTGTNFIGAIHALAAGGQCVATLICDGGERYAGTLDNEDWLAAQGFHVAAWEEAIDRWYAGGDWLPPQAISASEPCRRSTGRAAE